MHMSTAKSFSVSFPTNDWEQPDHIGRAVEITPDMAQVWLDAQPLNRPVRQSAVEMYHRAFDRGEAIASPAMPIILDRFGTLKDGQHRLWAIVMLGRPVTLWVLTGDFDLLEAYHSNLPRSLSDSLTINYSVQNAATVASIARLVAMRMVRPLTVVSASSNGRMTARETLSLYEQFGVHYTTLATQANQLHKSQILSNKITPAEIGYLLFQRPDAGEWLSSLLTDDGNRTVSQIACRKLLAYTYPDRFIRLLFVSKAFNNASLKVIKRESHVPDLIGGKFEGFNA
jgi:hypothetical protein